MLKITLATCALMVTAHCQAVFEVMYLPDVAANKVHRYDPLNRIYLGSFTVSAVFHVVAQPAASSLGIISGNSKTQSRNGSTGDMGWESTLYNNIGYINRSGTEIWTSAGENIRRINMATGALITGWNLTATPVAICESAPGTIALLTTRGTNCTLEFSSTSGAFLGGYIIGPRSNFNNNQIISNMIYVTKGGNNYLAFTSRLANQQFQLNYARLSTNQNAITNMQAFPINGYSTTSNNTCLSIMNGQNGSIYIAGRDSLSTGTRIIQCEVNTTSLTEMQNTTTTQFQTPVTATWSGSNVMGE